MRKNHKRQEFFRSFFLPSIIVATLLLVACPPVDNSKGSTYKHSPTTWAKLLEAIEAEIKAQKTPSPNLNNIDTSKITNMSYLFQNKTDFNGDISKWNVSKVTTMAYMFDGATKFKQNLDAWKVNPDTVDVTNMFTRSGISGAKIPTWLVTFKPSVTKLTTDSGTAITPVTFTLSPKYVTGTFAISSTLPEGLTLTDNTSPATLKGTPTKATEATDYTITFTGTGTYKRYKVSKTFSIEIITYKHTPEDKVALEKAITAEKAKGEAADYNSINTRNITDMSGLFQGKTDFNGDISKWNVSKVSTMANMFNGATAFNQNLEDWNVDPDTVDITDMFKGSGVADNNIPGWYLKITPSPTSLTLTKDAVIDPAKSITFTTRPADIAGSFSITPAIQGLNIDSSTRKITGTPTAESESTSYTVTFTVDGANKRTATATVQIEVGAAVLTPKITPSLPKLSVIQGNTITDITFTKQPTDMTGSFAIAPTSLPNGLKFSGSTGTISGTPTKPNSLLDPNTFYGKTTYTITFTGTEVFSDPKYTLTKELDIGVYEFKPTGADENAVHIDLIKIVTDEIETNGDNANLNNIDTSDVTDMHETFANKLEFVGDISKWDVSKATNMASMFSFAQKFNGDISKWDVSQVINMRQMFADTGIFNGNISKWDVSQVTNMLQMFDGASAFNQDISDWDVNNVTDMNFMFDGAKAFNNGGEPLDWGNKTGNVKTMISMFKKTNVFNQDISGWDVKNVTNMSFMFNGAKIFNQNISSWEVKNVTDMSSMFNGASAFDQNLDAWGEHVRGRAVTKDRIFIGSPLANKQPDWAKVTTWNGR